MALRGKYAILYYGLLASVTGGWVPLRWLPVRKKTILLNILHWSFFVIFIFLPFSVYHVSLTYYKILSFLTSCCGELCFFVMLCCQIRTDHWSGWFTYAMIVLATFLILKIVNTRLHHSLGTDPVPEEEESKKEEEEEEEEGGQQEEASALEEGLGEGEDKNSYSSGEPPSHLLIYIKANCSRLAYEGLATCCLE